MTIQGLRHSDNFAPATARPQNWREGILLKEPNGKAPLFALTAAMKSKSVDDPIYHWFEKIMERRRVALTADPSTGTTFTTAAGAAFTAGIRIGHLLRVEQTNEIVRVTSNQTSGGTTFTVLRGIGAIGGQPGVVATAMNPATSGNNPNVHVVGVALEENSAPPTSVNFDPVERANYLQIFRDTLTISRTAQKTRLRTGDAVKEAKRECLQYHSASIEWAMWFGQRAASTGANGEPMRFMDGILQQILNGTGVSPGAQVSTQVINHAGASINLTQLENYLELAFRYGSSEKVAFCGNEAALAVQRVARLNSDYQFTQGQKEYGMNVSRLTCPFGDVVLKTHPLFNQITSGINTTAYYALSSWMFILDMADLEYKYLTDSDTQYEPKLAQNGLDGMQSGYLTECSIQLTHPVDHVVIRGLGAGANG